LSIYREAVALHTRANIRSTDMKHNTAWMMAATLALATAASAQMIDRHGGGV
jgi:hypothetical protein